MKILILKDKLKEGLILVERCCGKNLTLPILSCVLIEGKKNFLVLSSTDLEIGIHLWNLAKVEKEGRVAIPAKFLTNFINLISDQNLTLEEKNKILTLEGKNYKTQIKGLDPEEFPIIPTIKDENFIEIDGAKFCQALSQVFEFAALTPARPELSGIFLAFEGEVIRMASTDNFRLAEKKLTIDYKTSPGFKGASLILPQKSAKEIINIFSNQEGKIKIYFSPNQVLFESLLPQTKHPEIHFISRLIEGEYPEYREIIPQKYETQVILNRADFLNQLRAASLFTGKINEVKLGIDPQRQNLEIFAQHPDLGENRSILSGKVKGKKAEISFNWRFLVDGLQNISAKEISFEVLNQETPALIRPVGDKTYLYVIMPIIAG